MSLRFREPDWPRWAVTVALGVGFLVVASSPAGAQRRGPGRPPALIDAAGEGPNFDLAAARRRATFRLFGNQDLAFSGIRGVGNMGSAVSNVGPCENGLPPFCHGVPFFHAFELKLVAGVPRGDWIKNRDRAPSLRSVRGDGYSFQYNDLLFTGKTEIGPHDGTLGTLFSGATTTEDGTCQDHSSSADGFMDPGLQLLAGSGCTATWAGGVFGGDHPIPLASWVQLFQSQGAAFAFDFHRVPGNLKRLDRFLGSNYSTYGAASDFHSAIRGSYGSVIPGGTGDPVNDGWPLGLVFEFQMYTFSLPTVASSYFWQMLIINRSADVYGVGLDYDSLYAGISTGTGFGPQAGSLYYEPRRGSVVFVENGVNFGCNAPIVPTGVEACLTTGRRGFLQGAGGIVMLKSPIGDLRNKLFSDPTSPFFNLAHPRAGDTLTFNHAHFCRFSACSNTTVRFSDKRGFGMLSSTEENVLDGRAVGSLSAAEYWQTFRGRLYPTRDGKFNVYVPPGNWDYNRDGVRDTLHLDTCGGPAGSLFVTAGCVTTFADTMPGKQNNRGSNIGGIWAAGPFRLAAGDTAAFLMAFIGESDSIRFESTINNIIDFYKAFFFGPEAPPPVDVVSTEVVSGGDLSRVSIFFTDAPERFTDPFLTDFAGKVAAAPAGTELARLRTLNPNLVNDILARAADNLEEIQIYKSCDGGTTFTSDGDCDGDPAEDTQGNPIGTGWQAYGVLRRSDFPGGDLPNVFTDGAVLGGRSFLYSFVGKTRGAEFLVRDSLDTDGDGLFDAVGGRVFTIAPPILNSLSRSASDPNVAAVYIPFSRQAGHTAARLTFTGQAGGATVPFEALFTENVTGGTYAAVFGEHIRIVELRHPVVTDSIVSTTVLVEDTVFALDPATGTGVTARFDARTGTTGSPFGVGLATSGTTVVTRTTVGNTRTTDLTGALGFVLFREGTGEPIFASTVLTGFAATPSTIFAQPDFPGFVISADNRGAGRFAAEATTENSDTIPQARVNDFRVQWRQETSVPTALAGGDYHVNWTADPFGVSRGLTLNFRDPAATEAELAAALAARAATAARADTSVASLLGVAPSELVPARLPFTITNRSTGRPVTVVVFGRLRNSIVLGNELNDTIRVAVPVNEWVPGDRMAFVEGIEEDSLSGRFVVVGPGGQPVPVLRPRVTFTQAILGCNFPRESCNPTAPGTRGSTGYLPLTTSTMTSFHYFVGFRRGSSYSFAVTAPISGSGITNVTRTQLDSIRVVPNPFVVFSTFQANINEPRVVFTHMPPSGTLRVYTVSGQFVQQIRWTSADLSGNGDLHYNLRTREGTDLASGLYIWVLTTDVGNRRQQARGKFVVVRGRAF